MRDWGGTFVSTWSPPAGCEPLEAMWGLPTLYLSPADQVLSPPRPGAPWLPPLLGPLLPVPSALGSPCLEGRLLFLPHAVTSNRLLGLCSEPILRGPHAGPPRCLPLRGSTSPRGLSRHRHRAVTGPCLHFQGAELLRAWIPLC